MKKISIDNVALHNKRLVALWQHDHFSPRPKKLLDGTFISSNLFSVYVYTTAKEDSVIKTFAQKVDAQLSETLAEMRSALRKEQRKLSQTQETPILSAYKAPEAMPIRINTEQVCPSSLALIKLYIALDNFILRVHEAKNSGDISHNECEAFKNRVIKQLNRTLNTLRGTCSKFHKVRKAQ